MQLDLAGHELMQEVCQRIAAEVGGHELSDLAFSRWFEGVGPGPRVRDLQLVAVDALAGSSLMVHVRRSFLVSRVPRAKRADWVMFSRERLLGVLDPTKIATEDLETFLARYPDA